MTWHFEPMYPAVKPPARVRGRVCQTTTDNSRIAVSRERGTKKSPATAGHKGLWLWAQADEEEENQPGPVTKQRRVAVQYNHIAA